MDRVVDRRDELSEEELDRVVAQVKLAMSRAGARGMVDAGQAVLDSLFGGDYEGFSASDTRKLVSLRQVAERLKTNRQTLANRVHAAQQYARLPEDVRDLLSPSHHLALLAAPPLERARLAREAAVAELSVADLRARITGKPPPRPAAVDRTPLGALERAISRLQQAASDQSFFDAEGVNERLNAAAEKLASLRRAAKRASRR